mmetsp:Transcript_65542/g.146268  ORF Transcript_65542/g.146268 Transcript_65542/m.146268 type:complete len:205 (+) Transcript_65542:200-814(+)
MGAFLTNICDPPWLGQLCAGRFLDPPQGPAHGAAATRGCGRRCRASMAALTRRCASQSGRRCREQRCTAAAISAQAGSLLTRRRSMQLTESTPQTCGTMTTCSTQSIDRRRSAQLGQPMTVLALFNGDETTRLPQQIMLIVSGRHVLTTSSARSRLPSCAFAAAAETPPLWTQCSSGQMRTGRMAQMSGGCRCSVWRMRRSPYC